MAPPAHAQIRLGKELINFLMPGGYLLTDGHARDVLGNPLFYGEANLFGPTVDVGAVGLSAGIKVISGNSNYLPFTGGNEFQLIGPSVGVSTFRVRGFRPFASAGFFAGHIKSDRAGFVTDKWDFTPALAAGLDVPIASVLNLRLQYRITESIAGVNTTGFAATLRLF